MADMEKLRRALNPRTAVVIGSKRVNEHMWLRARNTFTGKLYSVQIDEAEIPSIEAMGIANYKSLLDIPEEIDYVTVAVPRGAIPFVLKDCITKDVAGVHLFTAGYSETGTEEGRKAEAIVNQMARDAGLNLIGPNCMGLFNPKLGIRQSPEQYSGVSGPVGFLSQSGTQAIAFSLVAEPNGVLISKSVSYGNGHILDSADYLECLAEDEETKVIGIYIEGVRNGRRFFDVLSRTTKRKPVVIWKGGQTSDSARATASHTGSLAVAHKVWEAIIRQAGAISVDSLDELVDVLKALIFAKPGTGTGMGLVAMSGGHSVEISDAFSKEGLRVPMLSQSSYDKLATFFNIIGGSYRNPLEGGGNMALEEKMRSILEILDDDPVVDAVVVEHGAGLYQRDKAAFDRRLETLCWFRERSAKPLLLAQAIATFKSEPASVEEANKKLLAAQLPSFNSFARAARALRKTIDFRKEQQAREAFSHEKVAQRV